MILFITELQEEQWVVDKLIEHEGHNVKIELLYDEILLSCEDCHEVVLNYFKKGVVDY